MKLKLKRNLALGSRSHLLVAFSYSKPKTVKIKNAIIESFRKLVFFTYTLCNIKKLTMLIFILKNQLNQILNKKLITQKLHNFYKLLILNENKQKFY